MDRQDRRTGPTTRIFEGINMNSLIRLMCLEYVLCFFALVMVLSAPRPSNAQRALAYPSLLPAPSPPVVGGFLSSYLQAQQMLQLAGTPVGVDLGGFNGGFGH